MRSTLETVDQLRKEIEMFFLLHTDNEAERRSMCRKLDAFEASVRLDDRYQLQNHRKVEEKVDVPIR